MSLHDMNSGLKAMRREVVTEVPLYGELHRYFPVLAAARGFAVSEIPVVHHARKFGKSKYSSKRVLHAAFDLASTLFITYFEHEPMQIFGLTGGIGIVLGFIILVYMSALHFLGQTIGDRPLLYLGMLLVLFGMQMVSTGLLAELLTHKRRFDASDYPIEEVVE